MAIAAVERDRGDLAASRTTTEAALTLTEALRAKITDAGLRASYVARVQETYESYVDLLMRLHEQSPPTGYDVAALQAAERTRARVLLESLLEASADIRRGVDASSSRASVEQRKLDEASERVSRGLAASRRPTRSPPPAKISTRSARPPQTQAQIRTYSPQYAALTQSQPAHRRRNPEQRDRKDTVLLEFASG